MAPFDLAVHFGAGRRDASVSHAKVGQVPSALWAKEGIVVGLDALDGEGQAPTGLIEEGHRRTRLVVVVDPGYAVAGRLINGGELVEALASSSNTRNEFHPTCPRCLLAAVLASAASKWFRIGF